MRAESLGLKAKCRQLESETTFAEVFDKYEHEIEDLVKDVRMYREEISNLKLLAVDAERNKEENVSEV